MTLACPRCATQIAPSLRSCPACGWLAHGVEVQKLSTEAERCASAGKNAEALERWRAALDLLPPGSEQHTIITARVADLSRRVETSPFSSSPDAAHHRSQMPPWLAGLGAAGVVLWKLKFLLVFLLTKAKFLLFGLSKIGTLTSMLLSVGVYWTLWGWRFALGLVLSIYIHEMGHVSALRRFGIKASAPMFLPGLGAVIRLRQNPVDAREDARVGLAGPNWGLAAALACALIYLLRREPYWAAIAGVGAWINLFNLTPVLGLDGDRAFRPMNRLQKILAVSTAAIVLLATGEGILFLLLIVGGFRCLDGGEKKGDWIACGNYVGLVVALSLLSLIRGAAGG